MKAYFVTFESPGTFFNETTTKPIPCWDVELASKMAREIKERYNAVPFAFYFSTRERSDDELDSKQTQQSGRYFLGGTIETIEEIEARDNPDEEILRSNMRCNGWNRMITNNNSWKITQPLQDDDTVLDWKP